jgi:glycosyltransferase involved in cell wall biosynthesis
MKVSVVIPTHNRAKMLKRAVDSVLNQTVLPEEIIIIDDCSDDETLKIMQKHPSEKLRILQQTENKGVSAARNRGIGESQSNWVVFLDSDDWWLPQKLEKQINFHKKFPQFLISQTDEVWIRNGVRVNPKKYHLKKAGWIFDICLKRCMITPSAAMINKQIFEDVGMFDENIPACEDYDLWLRVTHKYQVGLVNEKLVVKTGGHSSQLSSKYWGMDRLRVQALEKILQHPLEIEKQKSVLDMLIKKSTILALGSLKRNELERAQIYQSKVEEYQSTLEYLNETYHNKS